MTGLHLHKSLDGTLSLLHVFKSHGPVLTKDCTPVLDGGGGGDGLSGWLLLLRSICTAQPTLFHVRSADDAQWADYYS